MFDRHVALVFVAVAVSLLAMGCASVSMNEDPEGGPSDLAAPAHPNDFAVALCGTCPAHTVCDAQTRHCVACLVDADCDTNDVCRKNACVLGCSTTRGCGDAGVCDLDGGVCGGCTSDSACTDPSRPVCDRTTGLCAVCTPTHDTCGAGTYCAFRTPPDAGTSLDAGLSSDGSVESGSGSDGGVVDVGGYGCVPGCKVDQDCVAMGLPSSKCCGHVCTETKANKMNCGACGNVCGAGSDCCNAQCINLMSDTANCGGCGVTCNFPHANTTCSGGKCAIASCKSGYGDCDKYAFDGCETSLDDDDFNCGKCGKECFFVCSGGGCVPF